MQLKELLNDDDAVSPVIGVILMVAITVILAAVIATFVLGLGEQVSETAPNANFEFDYEDDATGDAELTVTHTSGPAIEAGTLSLSGAEIDETFAEISDDLESDSDVSAGTSITADINDQEGETVSVTWASDGQSATLATFDIPEN